MPYLYVAVGGWLGACARYGMMLWLGSLPWTTFLINLLGSIILTWFYTVTQERFGIHPNVRLGIGTGFIGAFTTFSTFTRDAWSLFVRGRIVEAIAYILASQLICLVGAWLGYQVANRQTALRFTEDTSQEL